MIVQNSPAGSITTSREIPERMKYPVMDNSV